MDAVVLLAELRALCAETPDFATYTPTSRVHLEWLAKTHALLLRWEQTEAGYFRDSCDWLPSTLMRDVSVGKILGILHRAVADLELRVPNSPNQVFGPGAVYDFVRALRGVLNSATSSLLVVDPYLDDQIFDAYLSTVEQNVSVRLLTSDHAKSLGPSVRAFVAQKQIPVEVRISRSIHDRVVFVDDRSCWVLGQSVKDAAKTKPTYLAPLSSDAAKLKRPAYEQLWSTAIPI